MRYIRGFREGAAAAALAQLLEAEVDPRARISPDGILRRPYACHLPLRRGGLAARNVRLVHGPGCPVCVLAVPRLDAAIELARRPDVTLVATATCCACRHRAGAACSRRARRARTCAWCIRRSSPWRSPQPIPTGRSCSSPSASRPRRRRPRISSSRRSGWACATSASIAIMCVTPAAIQSILDSPEVREWGQVRVDGFIGPSHVSAVIGSRPYEYFAEEYQRPVVIAGFEPLDVMQAIHMLVQQLNAGRGCVENQFTRGVTREGNAKAQRLVAEVFELRPSFEWRGLGELPYSGLRIKSAYAEFDAERRFAMRGAAGARKMRRASARRSSAASRNPPTARSLARHARRAIRSAHAWCPRKAPALLITSIAAARCRRPADAHPAAGARLQQPCRNDSTSSSPTTATSCPLSSTSTIASPARPSELFRPEVVLAPFLKRAIPRLASGSGTSASSCIPDRRAIAARRRSTGRFCAAQASWGVTVLQAEAELDAGPVWAQRSVSDAQRDARAASIVMR